MLESDSGHHYNILLSSPVLTDDNDDNMNDPGAGAMNDGNNDHGTGDILCY